MRWRFRLLMLATGLALVAGCQTTGIEGTVVTATGDPAKDVAAVQAAVDQGGPIVLAGNFNFGETGRVIIRHGVAISGRGETRIRGGFWTFHSPLPEKLPPEAPGPQISIRNIHFDGALWAPINIAYASQLVVLRNRITNVRPHPYPRPNLPDLQIAQGVLFGTFAAHTDSMKRAYVPDAVTGMVIVEDNTIDMRVAEPLKTLGQGIWGVWTTGIDARIARNRVTNASRNGIEMIDNYRGRDGKGVVRIEANTVTTPRAGVPAPTPRTPNGIVMGFFLESVAGADPARNSSYVAEGNVIELQGSTSIGIAAFSDGAEVRKNRISADGRDAQPIIFTASRGSIAGNVLRGTGGSAMSLTPFREMTASGNTLVGNDLRDFKAAQAQVLFGKGSGNNSCADNAGLEKVADQGNGNRCP